MYKGKYVYFITDNYPRVTRCLSGEYFNKRRHLRLNKDKDIEDIYVPQIKARLIYFTLNVRKIV